MSTITSPLSAAADFAPLAPSKPAVEVWPAAPSRFAPRMHTRRSRVVASLGISLFVHLAAIVGLSLAVAMPGQRRWIAVEQGRASIALRASMADRASTGEVERVSDTPIEFETLCTTRSDRALPPAPTPTPDDAVTPEPRLAMAVVSPAIASAFPQATERLQLEPKAAPPRPIAPPRPDMSQNELPRPAKTNVGRRSASQLVAGKVDSQASPASVASRGADTNIPAIVHNPAPDYPADALQSQQTGRVVLDVGVTSDGSVAWAKIHSSSGVPSLDKAALEVIYRWRFSPAEKATGVRGIRVPIRFVIENS